MTKEALILDMRPLAYSVGILDYLKAVFPDIKFITDKDERGRITIGSEPSLTNEKKLEVCNKLKLTSAPFVRFDKIVCN